jgi:hypothetical protein
VLPQLRVVGRERLVEQCARAFAHERKRTELRATNFRVLL